jgi:predicted ATPase/class 3 adenylate cyclase
MRQDLPTGSVTFLFTDVEGSTRLLHQFGAEAYAAALAEHRRIVRDACAAANGIEVDTQGDAFFFAFPTAPGALAAAQAITRGLEPGPIHVRIGLHTGMPLLTDEGYIGADVHFAARVAAAGHGGQVILSKASRELLDETIVVTDLGEHRLKDIAGPVWIFQLGEERFPPLKTISNTNLPRPASSFVGRERELAAVVARIRDGARLLTLTGPGGSGKTRLAIEAAATLVPEYKSGVFWVGLAALRDPALVLETVAQTLGAKAGLVEYIGQRELLLLLDNLEQLIEMAPELSSLLPACPKLALLVTSRELLRVQGEVEYQVPPLASEEAVSLFCERAQVEPSEQIRELCARLDNLPLAVELAAARVQALSPAQILARLASRLDMLQGGRDAVPRQQTLRATIDWSYELLDEEEQRTFRSLSVFAGGSTFDAAAAVCDAELDTLQSLIEKSLLRRSGDRYDMLETIREFAAEELEAAGQTGSARDRHARYFLELARHELEKGGIRRGALTEPTWLRLCALEQSNFRLAIDYLASIADADAMAILVNALWTFWLNVGATDEGEGWTQSALALMAPSDSPERAWLLGVLGEFPRFTGREMAAIPIKRKALEMARRVGARTTAAAVLADLCGMYSLTGDLAAARACGEESLKIRRELGVPHGVAHALDALADLALASGDAAEAERLLLESQQIWEDPTGPDLLGALESAIGLARAKHLLSRPVEAAALYDQALGDAIEVDNRWAILDALNGIASVRATSEPVAAAELLGTVESEQERVALRVRNLDEHQALARDLELRLGPAEYAAAISRGRGRAPAEWLASTRPEHDPAAEGNPNPR